MFADASQERPKSLAKRKWALTDLQALEMPQNRQRIPWKSLRKNAPDLEKLA
jgi:hypothetical protein